MEVRAARDRQLQEAQVALLTRFVPEARVRRLRWSQGETQVLEVGAGSPVLLVHGGLDSALTWTPVLERVARRHRAFAVDLPGHGLADPFDFSGVQLLDHARMFLREIVDALDVPVVDIIANSVGGLYAVAFAIDAPQHLSRLVLVGAPAGLKRPGVPPQLRLLGLPLIGQPLGRILMRKPTRDGNRKFWGQVLVVHPERLDDGLLDADVASQVRNIESHLSLIGCIADGGGLRQQLILGDRWQTLATPTLILWGDHDAFLTPKHGEDMATQNRCVRVVRIAEAGHLPWHDEPERVVAEIDAFLSPPIGSR